MDNVISNLGLSINYSQVIWPKFVRFMESLCLGTAMNKAEFYDFTCILNAASHTMLQHPLNNPVFEVNHDDRRSVNKRYTGFLCQAKI